jgi:8-oxo-dGTP pyrophosphatase MutT (NUDIX family)
MPPKTSSALTLVFDQSKTFILLVKRRDVPMWVLPGGGVDPGETPMAAAEREVKEESCLAVTIERHAAHYSPLNRLTTETHLFTGTANDGVLGKTDESCDAAFFRLDEFPVNTFYIHRNWIEEIMKSEGTIRRPLHEVTYFNVLKYFIKNPLTFLRYLASWLGFPLNS